MVICTTALRNYKGPYLFMFDAWPIHERDAYAALLDATGAGQLGEIIDSLLLTPFWEMTDTVTGRNPQKCGRQ
jgi:hypothetical protein